MKPHTARKLTAAAVAVAAISVGALAPGAQAGQDHKCPPGMHDHEYCEHHHHHHHHHHGYFRAVDIRRE